VTEEAGPARPGQLAWRTFSLRVIQASWGIAIDLRARAVIGDDLPPDSLPAGDRVALDLNGVQLPAEEVEQLLRGLRLMVHAIASAHPGVHVLVQLGAMSFTPTDFQPEGLVAAMIGWAAEEFGLEQVPWDLRFDKSTNRYLLQV